MSSVPDDRRPGNVIADRYRIVESLGRGGGGATFRCDDLLLGSTVAVKLVALPSAAAVAVAEPDPRTAALRREFELLRSMRHPHLLEVIDFGWLRQQRRCFYTARYLSGQTIDRWARGATWSELRVPVADALDALAHLHALGVRHGDISLGNILVDDRGRATLIDLGCAMPLAEQPGELVSGSPAYMAPELARGRADQRTDLYAFGVVLQRLGKIVSLPSAVRRAAQRCTQQAPSRRPASASALMRLLEIERRPAGALAVPSGTFGRERELALLSALLTDLERRAPSSRVLWCHGPPGIGKSQLVREIKWRAQQRVSVLEVVAGAPSPLAMVWSHLEVPEAGGVMPAVEAAARLAEGAPVLVIADDVHRMDAAARAQLLALARSFPSAGASALVCASSEPPPPDLDGGQIALGPLGEDALAEWLAPLSLPRPLVALIGSVSGGSPAQVGRLALGCARGELSASSLRRAAGARGVGDSVPDLAALDADLIAGLAIIGCATSPPAAQIVLELGVARGAIDELARRRLVSADDGTLRLASGLSVDDLASAAGVEAIRAAHLLWTDSELSPAAAVAHLVGAGQIDAARRRWIEDRAQVGEATPELLAAARALMPHLDSAELAGSVARVLLDFGHASDAVAAAGRGLDLDGDADRAGILRAVLGRAYMLLGDHERALESLRRAWEARHTAEVANTTALVLIRQGEYREAMELAEEGLTDTHCDPRERAELATNIALAATYLGDGGRAADALAQADELIAAAPPGPEWSRQRVRAASAAAFAAMRAGDLAAAVAGYQRGYEQAIRSGLDDLAVSAAGNAGAAAHQQGEWGLALSAYQHGLVVARATGASSPAARLAYNLGTLQRQIGDDEAARTTLVEAREGALAHQLPFVAASAALVLAEIERGAGQVDRAAAWLGQARAGFVELAAARELVEVDLEAAHQELVAGLPGSAGAAFDRVAQAAAAIGARDLQARALVGRGSALVAADKASEALRCLDRADQIVSELQERPLVALVSDALADAARAAGAVELADSHRQRARAAHERLAASLPEQQRALYLERNTRPERAGGASSTTVTSRPEADRWRRLLEINRRLAAARDVDALLEETMAAAIELTGGERGFLILAAAGGGRARLRVPVARNLDREQIGRSHLKFSHSIAEKVVASGEPLVTFDAAGDERFAGNESVHAMRLKSVVCVPIRIAGSVAGAIYIDNRFRRGGFGEEDVELLLAFADQVAIALDKARLIAELADQTAELEQQRQAVQSLLSEREARIDELSLELDQRRYAGGFQQFGKLIGTSGAMRDVFALLDRVADSEVTVLIRGESGTGKELAARAIHDRSGRKAGPFVAIDCASLPASLLEAELFGHERGAFTGADRRRAGLFVAASGGTIFLDELGEMPIGMQAKLLRVLQEREVRPIGAREPTPVDVRVVCATNRDLKAEVKAGRFRQDLYFRVAVVEVEMPPLRERVEDIPTLTAAILERIAGDDGRAVPALSRSAVAALATHSWPGNVRELENVLTRAALLADDTIDAGHLAVTARAAARHQLDRAGIVRALAATGWNASRAAETLGVGRATLYRRLKQYGIRRPA